MCCLISATGDIGDRMILTTPLLVLRGFDRVVVGTLGAKVWKQNSVAWGDKTHATIEVYLFLAVVCSE